MDDTLRPLIYISGPITHGDREHNFRQAADAHKALMLRGFAVINPIPSMLIPGAIDIPHKVWIASDLPAVLASKAVYRLPGFSPGSDIECEFAAKHDIPIYFDAEELGRDFADRLKPVGVQGHD